MPAALSCAVSSCIFKAVGVESKSMGVEVKAVEEKETGCRKREMVEAVN